MKKLAKPKIIVSSYDDRENPFYGGGGAIAVHEIAKRLADKYEITVITGEYPNCKDKEVDGVRYKRVGTSRFGVRTGQLIFQALLPFYVVTQRFDLWVESFTPPFSTAFLPLFTKKPLIGLVHMLSAEDMKRKYKLPFKIIENLGLRVYRNFISTTDGTKKKILEQNPNARVEVIPNGVNLPKLLRKNAKSKKHILFIGRIEVNQKGLDLLLAAYKLIADKIEFKLVIAGAGEVNEEKRLKRLISQLKLERAVELVGRVEGREWEEAFEDAILVVVPSRFENFSLVSLEALSYGIPTVCFDIEGLRWLPKEACVKVKPFGIEDLSKAVLSLVEDKKRRLRVSENGRKFVRSFTWDAAAKAYKEKIRGMLRPSEMSAEELVRTIVKRKLACYFISPHFDDAIFSAGGLISYLSDKTKVTVIDVFTKGGKKPYTISAKRHLALCGYKSASKLYSARRLEDAEVLKKAKVKVVNLGFKDALWRRKKLNIFTRVVDRVLPELSHIYPIYRLDVVRGGISKNDRQTVVDLEKKLTSLIGGDCLVFCPAAIGRHVDHLIVKVVCERMFENKIYWSDYPYNLKGGPEKGFIKEGMSGELVFTKNFKQKERLMRGYKTQLEAVFPDGQINLVPEIYYPEIVAP